MRLIDAELLEEQFGIFDADILAKAVTWLIILIVIIFDPLAIALLLASQLTFAWHKSKPSNYNTSLVSSDTKITTESKIEESQFEPTDNRPTLEIEPEDKSVSDNTIDSTQVTNDVISNDSIAGSDTVAVEDNPKSVPVSQQLVDEANRYIIDSSKKKAYMIKDPDGNTKTLVKS